MIENPKSTCSCTSCNNEFPATSEYFYKDRGGLRASCKNCTHDKRKDYYATHKEEINMQRRENYADHSKEYNAKRRENGKEYYAKRKEYDSNYYAKHKKEREEYNKEYYANHSEKIKDQNKQYAQTEKGRMVARIHGHKRRALKQQSGGSYTAHELQEQLKRQKNKCYYCKAKLNKLKWHADHVMPLSRGGSNTIDNIVCACPTCNMRKNAKILHEWIDGGRLI